MFQGTSEMRMTEVFQSRMRITEVSWYTLGGREHKGVLVFQGTSEMRMTEVFQSRMRITEFSWYTLGGLGIMEAS
jgi:hypothetical protein